jgi:beta-glucosidase
MGLADHGADDAHVEVLLAKLARSEKVALAAGVDTWHTAAAGSIGLPALKLSDGPSGARGASFGAVPSASFPCGSALGATWSPELLQEVGAALGREARWKGARVLLAPTINIQRHPFGGRHFECYSEDPFLTSRLAVAYITGVQSQGVAATAKHFVCNDSEFRRHTISSEVSERALREIYLPPFEAAVGEGGVWALMAAYNRINGTYASEHDLLVDLVKGEWGFDGVIVSDWWGTMSTVAAATHGLDLEMPGPPVHFGDKLSEAVDAGQVSEADLDDKARRLIRMALRVHAREDVASPVEEAPDDPLHRALLRKAAAEAAVLLTNDGMLPIETSGGESIAIIGPLAERLTMQGGGSAYVEPHRAASLLEAVRARYEGTVRHEPGCRIFKDPPPLNQGMSVMFGGQQQDGALLEYFTSPEMRGEPVDVQLRRRLHLIWLGDPDPGKIDGQFSARLTTTYRPSESGEFRFTLASAGRSRLLINGACIVDNWTEWKRGNTFYGSGSDVVQGTVELAAGAASELVVEYQAPEAPGIRGVTVGCLPPPADDLIDRAVALAADSSRVLLVVGSTAETEKEGGDRTSLSLPGEQDELIRRVAAANPNTTVVVNAASPLAMPWVDRVRAVLWGWFPGQQGDEGLADVLFGDVDPGGRLPMTMPARVEDCPAHAGYPGHDDAVRYDDDVFVGYRGYQKHGTSPLFAFGHGLSYTTFEFAPMEIDRAEFLPGESVQVSIGVTNTGDTVGSQVVQVYVRDVSSSLPRPDLELKGFGKVHLQPGERGTVEVTLPPRAFAAWDPHTHGWLVEPGEFEIVVGTSSADLHEQRTVVCRNEKEHHAF